MHNMSASERRTVAVLASIYGLRIFGLFLILPVFAVYAAQLQGHTPLLIGVALGAYGLTQALLQIPFGVWSDRFGRKPVIVAGLLVFAMGSALAALADSIAGVIIGRALQGAGAISAAVMALVADLTRADQRTKAMAAIGSTIGAAFILSIMVSPVLAGWWGVRGIFWFTAIAAGVAIAVLLVWVPTPLVAAHAAGGWRAVPGVLRDVQLRKLNVGIFVLHAALTALFVVLPPMIIARTGLPLAQHWKLYLPVMLLALAAMAPFVLRAHRGGRARSLMMGAIAILIVGELLLYASRDSVAIFIGALWLFFAAFNLLEAMLPALVSRAAPSAMRGAAMGVYSTSQFLGAFAGGLLSGAVLQWAQPEWVFLAVALLLLGWAAVAYGAVEPAAFSTHIVRLRPEYRAQGQKLVQTLARIRGVREAVVIADEGVAHLTVDPRLFDIKTLDDYAI